MSLCLCPHCGYNLEAERPLVAGRFAFDPRGGFTVDGTRLAAGPLSHELIGALMGARGRVLSRDAIHARLASESATRCADVYASRARRALRALGVEPPFSVVWGQGWHWTGPAVVTA